jgi:hypothetical protein
MTRDAQAQTPLALIHLHEAHFDLTMVDIHKAIMEGQVGLVTMILNENPEALFEKNSVSQFFRSFEPERSSSFC